MADGMLAFNISNSVDDPHALGFVARMRGASIVACPYVPLSRKSTIKYDEWRRGWMAYHAQCITDGIKEIFWDVPQLRNPATQEYFEAHRRLPELLEKHLQKVCVRP